MSSIKLTSEGYSFHTMELKVHPDGAQYRKVLKALDEAAKRSKVPACRTYPLSKYRNEAATYCSTVLSSHGVLLYLTETVKPGCPRFTIKAVVNPRKVLDHKYSYLGIMPTDSDSFQTFQDRFTLLMRKYGLPDFLDDWTLNRLDLCVNLLFKGKKSAREISRLLHKDLLPPKMERVFFFNPSASPKVQAKQKRADKHSLCLQNDSYGLVVYDKLFQLKTEALEEDSWEKFPDGILRLELRCYRPYIKKLLREEQHDASEQIPYFVKNSRELILKQVNRAFTSGTHYKPDAAKTIIQSSKLHRTTCDQLSWMVQRMRYSFDNQQLEKGMKKQFGVKPRTVAKRLEQLQDLGINPVPLRKDFYLEQLPSLPQILELLEDDTTTVKLNADGSIAY